MIEDFYGIAIEPFALITSNMLVLSLIFSGLAIATYTDIKQMIIPNWLNASLLVLRGVVIFIPMFQYAFGWTHLLGGIAGGLALLIPAMILMHKMGGDIKLIGVLGLYFGLIGTIIFLLLSSLYMLLYSAVRKAVSQSVTDNKTKLTPFAPFFFASFLTLCVLGYASTGGFL